MLDLLNKACDFLSINIDSLNKLNLKKLDYGYRVRYIKDDNGIVIQKIMDRGFIGLMPSKIGVESSSDILTCFIYGKKTVGFYIDGRAVYANRNLDKSSDFICLLYNVIESKNLIWGGWVDNLPTGEIVRNSQPKTLDALMSNIKTVDELTSDVGF